MKNILVLLIVVVFPKPSLAQELTYPVSKYAIKLNLISLVDLVFDNNSFVGGLPEIHFDKAIDKDSEVSFIWGYNGVYKSSLVDGPEEEQNFAYSPGNTINEFNQGLLRSWIKFNYRIYFGEEERTGFFIGGSIDAHLFKHFDTKEEVILPSKPKIIYSFRPGYSFQLGYRARLVNPKKECFRRVFFEAYYSVGDFKVNSEKERWFDRTIGGRDYFVYPNNGFLLGYML